MNFCMELPKKLNSCNYIPNNISSPALYCLFFLKNFLLFFVIYH